MDVVDETGSRASRKQRWRPFQFSLATLFVLLVVAACVFWWLRPELLDEHYFPMEVGSKWVYASTSEDGPEEIVFELTGETRVGGVECFVVQRSIGGHRVTFYVSVDRKGVRVHQIGEDRYEPPFRQFAFRSKQGDAWSYNGRLGGQKKSYQCRNHGVKEVRVPAGKWKAYHVSQLSEGYGNFWLVKGIGVVKLQGKSWDEHDPAELAGDPLYFDWELKEFVRP